MERQKFGAREVKKYAYLYESIENPIIQKRTRGSLQYFIGKATYYKDLWIAFSTLSIAFPALSTYLVALNLERRLTSIFISTISMATTLVTGYLALFKCADKKLFYRDAAESMKSEISRYLCATGVYEGCRDSASRERMFAENLERLVKSSNRRIGVLEREQSLPQKV